MSSYKDDKRIRPRIKQELEVGVRTESGSYVAYTIDVSRGGVKVGSPLLPLGVQVELVIDERGGKHPFSGRVVREDGTYYVDHLSRYINSFFIRIDDSQFPNFLIDNYFI